jgi:hypothetical protein
MKVLKFSVNSANDAYQAHFPLHAQTRSPAHISEITERVLDCITDLIHKHQTVNDGDVLQALAIVSAIRIHMTNANPAVTERLMRALLADATDAVRNAPRISAGHT